MGSLLGSLLSVVVGAGLASLGVALFRRHRRVFHERSRELDLELKSLAEGREPVRKDYRVRARTPSQLQRELRFVRREYFRRTLVGVLTSIVGGLIAVGDWPILWEGRPALFALYWLLVILLLAWIMLLAALDGLALLRRG